MNHQNRDQAFAQEATPSTRRYAAINDNGRAKFKEPRSWALNWCGFSLGCLPSAFGDRDELGAVGESPVSQAGR